MDATSLYLFAAFALLAAGTVKGLVGLGLPTTGVAIMSIAIDIRTAIALVIVPMLITNIWQLYRSGEVMAAVRRYAVYVAVLMLGVAVTFALTSDAPDQVILAVLGAIILIYVAMNVIRWAPSVPDRWDRPAQVAAGAASGMMGGLAGVWAPPVALYLAARQADKAEFVRASGLLLMVGSFPLLLGYVQAGYLQPKLLGASVLMLVPTFAGFAIGEGLRGRLSEAAFRRAVLIFFVVMGLNLLRRAVFL